MKRYAVLTMMCLMFHEVFPQSSSSPFILNTDYARFRYDDKSIYLEVYYGFYPQLLTFVSRDGVLHASISLFMSITDSQTGKTFINREVVIPVETADTTLLSRGAPITSQMGLSLPYGSYSMFIRAVDSLAPDRRDSITLPISAQPFASGLALSDIELCSNIQASQNNASHFFKNSLEVVPNPMLTFGVTGSPMLFSYVEMYNLVNGKSYTLKSQVVDGSEKVIREASRVRVTPGISTVDVATMNVTSYPSGRYQLRILVLSEDGEEVGRREKTFYLYNPHIEQPAPTATAIKASELAGLDEAELNDEFRKAQYLATQPEIKMFGQITNEEGKRTFLAQFWTEVERGRLGNFPISRVEYLARATSASQKYRSFSREGWQTDRGRVMVLYGGPDEIERVPSSENARPYEIWRYFTVENGVEFVFVDRTGFGDYQLVHSTKRGELRDDSWERYLR